MNSLTRCPACSTTYKVVPDQLRISEGWVKCGECNKVFDASQYLFHADDETIPITVSDFANEKNRQPVTPCDQVQETHAALEPDLQPSREEPILEFQADHVSFLLDHSSTSVWQKPVMRGALALSGVVLLLGLLGQWTYYERDRLTATHPDMKPVLQLFCVPLNCTLSPLKRIESLVIDSAVFSKLGNDSYRLGFTLKNLAPMDLALPSIELTLTDISDQPIYRKTFTPADLGTPSITLGAEWPVLVTLRVKSESALPKVVGYRLMAFYS